MYSLQTHTLLLICSKPFTTQKTLLNAGVFYENLYLYLCICTCICIYIYVYIFVRARVFVHVSLSFWLFPICSKTLTKQQALHAVMLQVYVCVYIHVCVFATHTHTHVFVYTFLFSFFPVFPHLLQDLSHTEDSPQCRCEVATIRRLLKIIGLFCKRAL